MRRDQGVAVLTVTPPLSFVPHGQSNRSKGVACGGFPVHRPSTFSVEVV